MFHGVEKNYMFLVISLFSLGLQILMVQYGGEFVRTSPLDLPQWLITIALGLLGIPIGVLMRIIPMEEDPKSFFTHDEKSFGKSTDNDIENNSNSDKLLVVYDKYEGKGDHDNEKNKMEKNKIKHENEIENEKNTNKDTNCTTQEEHGELIRKFSSQSNKDFDRQLSGIQLSQKKGSSPKTVAASNAVFLDN